VPAKRHPEDRSAQSVPTAPRASRKPRGGQSAGGASGA
jgi:hypothetical protein